MRVIKLCHGAGNGATRRQIASICRQAILDACKIGDTRPVERVISMEQLAEALDK